MKVLKIIKFWIDYKLISIILKTSPNNLFSYPMLIELRFNREKLLNKYLKYNVPLQRQIVNILKVKEAAMKRHLGRELENIPKEVIERYARLERYKENTRICKEAFGEDCFTKEY